MWFKNLSLFRFTEPFSISSQSLQEKLEKAAFRPCGSMELSTFGWSSPRKQPTEELAQTINGCHMLCLQKEEKIIPPSVVNEQIAEKCAEIEQQQGRKPGKKERENIRDEIITTLLPRAFTHRKNTYGYFDLESGWLIVDAASSKKADEFTSFLRKTLDSLPIAPPVTNDRASAVMTQWLTNSEHPADITIEDECELRSLDDEGGIVRCKKHNLFSEEIQNHLSAGKEVIKLLVTWNDRLSFILEEDATTIKRLRFLDIVQEQAADIETGDEAAQEDADFTIMSGEMKEFLPRLLDILGGENVQSLSSTDSLKAASG